MIHSTATPTSTRHTIGTSTSHEEAPFSRVPTIRLMPCWRSGTGAEVKVVDGTRRWWVEVLRFNPSRKLRESCQILQLFSGTMQNERVMVVRHDNFRSLLFAARFRDKISRRISGRNDNIYSLQLQLFQLLLKSYSELSVRFLWFHQLNYILWYIHNIDMIF